VLISVAVLVILSLDGSEVLSLLFSKAYTEGHRFLSIQLAALALFALLDVFAHALMAAGRQYVAAGVLLTTVPLVWLSNYLLIPWFGPVGAAISLLFGMVVGTGLTGAIAYCYFGALIRLSTVIRVIIANVIVGLVSTAITVEGPLIMIKLAMLIGVYLIVLYISGEITGKDFGFSTKGIPERSTEALPGT
jgi:O-antigen/teichoic acid export membrane protein